MDASSASAEGEHLNILYKWMYNRYMQCFYMFVYISLFCYRLYDLHHFFDSHSIFTNPTISTASFCPGIEFFYKILPK